MKFAVNPKIFEKFPGVEIGVLLITGMDNKGHNGEILALLRTEEKHQKELLTGIELGSLPEISVWRKIYHDFGSGKDYRSSVESLLRRARGGEKPLPQINNLVDLYNSLSLKYRLPIGAEDLDKVIGDISLTFACGDENGTYIGGNSEEAAYQGEVIYKDQAGFICRRWNWREGDRTKIDEKTANAVLVIEKAPGVSGDTFDKSLEEAGQLVQKYLQGQAQVIVLNGEKNSFEIAFQTGSKAKQEKLITPVRKINPIKPISNQQVPSLFSAIKWESAESLTFILKQILYQSLSEVLPEIKSIIDFGDIHLEHPANDYYGDYSTNVAMVIAKRVDKKPIDIAITIQKKIEDYIRGDQMISYQPDSKGHSDAQIHIKDILEKISPAGQGFINLYLTPYYLITLILRLLSSREGVITTQMKNLKIAVEYTDPNPFKEFHLGHVYSNAIGEAISRMFEACQAVVWRGDFYGDVGMHVAKSVWGMEKKIKDQKLNIKDLEKLPLNERQKFLGEGYAMGVVKYEENKDIQEEIKMMNLLIYIAGQELLQKNKGWQPIVDYKQYVKGSKDQFTQVKQIYEAGLRWSLEYFETIYKKLGTKFDGYYPESWVGEYGMRLVEKGLNSGVLEKSEGSVIFRGEKYGLHTRVFVNKLGLPTYEAKDLGLAFAKYQDFRYDYSINVFGKEIDEYYHVVKAALIRIDPELGKKAFHLPHGMVKLPQGKMSSRSGNVVTFQWLITEVKKQALELMKKSDLSENERQQTAEIVGLGAIRYALLKSDIGNDIIFDLSKSISLDGDSGPYLQYTYARCKSVLRKAKDLNSNLKSQISNLQLKNQKSNIGDQDTCKVLRSDSFQVEESVIPNPEELSLLRTLYRFPEVVAQAARTLSPNLICSYLFDLAQKYNFFYNKHSILNIESGIMNNESGKKKEHNSCSMIHNSEKEHIKQFRLFLTESTSVVLKKSLHLLGIKTVERM